MDVEKGFDAIHTPERPYCRNLSCWCHTSIPYHDLVEKVLERQDSEQDQEMLTLLLVR